MAEVATRDDATPTTVAKRSEDLGAPLYVAWQITNECNLACLHCIEESGPGKAFPDELSEREVLAIIDQMVALEIPYVSFSGGEPMVHPHFFEMVRALLRRRRPAQDRDQRPLPVARRTASGLRAAGVKAVQVSLDGASRATFNRMRVRGEFRTAVDGVRNLRAAGVPIEVNFSPTRFNVDEIGPAVDLAHELGAYSFYTGRTMYTGNAVKAWRHIAPSEEQYDGVLRHAAVEGAGISRPHARPLPRDGTARGAALPAAAAGRAAHRPAERPGEAHQRAAVRLRRLAHRVARRRVGATSSARGGTRASRSSSTTSRTIRAGRRRCTSGFASDGRRRSGALRQRRRSGCCAW